MGLNYNSGRSLIRHLVSLINPTGGHHENAPHLQFGYLAHIAADLACRLCASFNALANLCAAHRRI
jgi:hypothetical protein